MEKIIHPLAPIYNKNSKILILGTMPSPKSREVGFYYGHPQNRFWKVMAAILKVPYPESIEEKKQLMLTHSIALWDVLKSCDIKGADDHSISDIEINDIVSLLGKTKIKTIYTTGLKATELYEKYCYPLTHIHSTYLPSTSPANCRYYTLEKLIEAYQVII